MRYIELARFALKFMTSCQRYEHLQYIEIIESLIYLYQLFVMKVNSHRMLSTRQSNTHNLIVKRIIYNC
jgi:hypothetical protein